MPQMVLRTINNDKDHPSIKVIKQHATSNGNTFIPVTPCKPNEVMKHMALRSVILQIITPHCHVG